MYIKNNLMKNLLSLIFILFIFSETKSENIIPIIEGNKNAVIKIKIYESMTCRHCADFHTKVYPDLKKEFIDEGIASIEFKNFPLDLAALNASKLVYCKNNGKSEIMHFLYKKQSEWVKGSNILDINNNLKNITETKFNLNFEKCLNNKIIENYILEDRISGSKKYEIQSTPTLIINDKKFNKPLNFKNLEKTIKKML